MPFCRSRAPKTCHANDVPLFDAPSGWCPDKSGRQPRQFLASDSRASPAGMESTIPRLDLGDLPCPQGLIGFLGSFGSVFLEFHLVFNNLVASFVNKTSFFPRLSPYFRLRPVPVPRVAHPRWAGQVHGAVYHLCDSGGARSPQQAPRLRSKLVPAGHPRRI